MMKMARQTTDPSIAILERVAWRPLRIATCIAVLLFALLLSGMYATLFASPVRAQADLQSYTVVAGDTLAAIADQYGVSLDELVALNNIADPSFIQVGQVLLIPSSASSTAGNELASIETTLVQAEPGETLGALAQRLAQDAAVLASLNRISETQQLFPGQSIHVPADAITPEQISPFRFGAVERVSLADTLVQGETGRLFVESTRPVSITATWNGLPLAFTPVPGEAATQNAHQAFALLPVPALLAPTPYPVVITYTTSSGVAVDRTWMVDVVEGTYATQDIVLPDDKGGLLDPEIQQAEEEKVYAVWSQLSPTLHWSDTFIWPVDAEYPTTSPYGTRRSYNSGPVASYHAGQDFGAPEGAIVFAPASGTVALAEPLNVRGNAVILDHGRGIFTGYWHLSEIMVSPGQQVQAGDVLGLVGTTGLSTGAHLHWELRIYTIAVNPMQFLEEPLLTATTP